MTKNILSKYIVINEYDISYLAELPYNTIYKILHKNYKNKFEPNEKIVLRSNNVLCRNTLLYIQQAVKLSNIDNAFILIISPTDISAVLNDVNNALSASVISIECIVARSENKIVSYIPKPLPSGFCIMPWVNLKITTQGNFKPCCDYSDDIHDNNDEKFNVSTNLSNINSVIKSNEINSLKTQFINNERPNKCNYCWELETNGHHSPRIEHNTTFKNLLHLINFEESTVSNILSLDLSLGTSCNLKCRICSPSASSSIFKERITQDNSINVSTHLNQIKNNSNYIKKNTNFWDLFTDLIPTIKMISFFGGEPLTINNQKQFLKNIINLGHANEIKLHYNTNGTVMPKNIINLWNEFKKVDIAFSIDDINQRFEYQRHGASWQQVQDNINALTVLAKSNPYTFSIYVTINIQNIYYLDELLDWYDTKKFNDIHFNILKTPKYLSVVHLSNETKRLIIVKLSKSKHYNKFLDIIKLLKNTQNNPSLEHKFIEYNKTLDKIRNENFIKTYPELSKIINFK